jgi:hypothetical protein
MKLKILIPIIIWRIMNYILNKVIFAFQTIKT